MKTFLIAFLVLATPATARDFYCETEAEYAADLIEAVVVSVYDPAPLDGLLMMSDVDADLAEVLVNITSTMGEVPLFRLLDPDVMTRYQNRARWAAYLNCRIRK